jgi:hypothetical protein
MMAFLTSKEGGIVMLVMAALISWFTWLGSHDAKVATKIEQKIVRASEMEGAARAKKSDKVRVNAAKPGAVDRLRHDPAACPDCGK